jgi:hypothetical protein
MNKLSALAVAVVVALTTTSVAGAAERDDRAVTSDGVVDQLVASVDAAFAGRRAAFGGYRWDAATGSLRVLVTDPQVTDVVRSRISRSARVVFSTVPRTYDEVNGSARTLFDTRASWAPDPSAVYTSHADEQTGTVVLSVRPDQVEQVRARITDPRVRVEAGAPVRLQAGTRRSDRGGWTGGNALQASLSAPPAGDADCTQGFTWKRWSNGALVGGIANHCVGGTRTTWYHDGRKVGTVFQTSPASDSALIDPVPGAVYSPTVWVGGRTTNVERPVVGVGTAVVGRQIALSGANSGLTVDTVLDDSVNSDYGPLVVMTGAPSVDGDSGGPWLNTQSGTGNAIAFGQHVGLTLHSGAYRSAFVPVTWISARLSASIALAS